MKTDLFPRLARTGIKKNGRLCFPYILSCTAMVMMYYIMHSLSFSPLLTEMKGGGNMRFILSLGKFVIAVFALLFLFYTNSFLVRRRYKEFGLYSVLGMTKKNICLVVLWENLITAAVSLVCGIGLGILFSKFAELGLLRAINAEVNYRFTVAPEAVLWTLGLFAAIFATLLLRSVIAVLRSRPIELLHSENKGEKAPRANYFIAALGLILLGAAYYLAVSIKTPLTALLVFFAAVLMVIAATYLLFVSGSVTFCRLLQKDKKYYYKKNHFVPVSSMVYRMKRNGAGLASICVLSTMVLVMLSSSSSLFFGMKDMFDIRFPYECQLSAYVPTVEQLVNDDRAEARENVEAVFAEHGVSPTRNAEYAYANVTGELVGEDVNVDPDMNAAALSYDNVREFCFISEEDYENITGTAIDVAPGEALVLPVGCSFDGDSLVFPYFTLKLTGSADETLKINDVVSMPVPTLMLVVDDYGVLLPFDGNPGYVSPVYYYGYDLPDSLTEEEKTEIFEDVRDTVGDCELFLDEGGGYGYSASCKFLEEADFFTAYGGLFFLGIMLSILFVFAAVMMIYYKQVSEGYEDRARFTIMQNVGMTKRDIKKSINSQILTVFFAPLVLSGVHLAFAFPLVWKILKLFGLLNLSFVIWVSVAAFVLFGIFYAIVYKLTARAYFRIVSE